MSSGTTFDPFAMMGFTGYIDPATGRPDQYHSLAHFVYSELAGVDEQYRRYLLQMVDPELFRLEVDGVGITGHGTDDWSEAVQQLLYAGIFMQALSNRGHFSELLGNADRLTVASCAFSQDAAVAMGKFIGDLRLPQGKLKVLFLGDCRDTKYVDDCLGVIFGKRAPQCLLALEDDGCSGAVSDFARKTLAPFSLLSSSLSDEAVVEAIRIRCTHVFNFRGGQPGEHTVRLLDQLNAAGVQVSPIQARV